MQKIKLKKSTFTKIKNLRDFEILKDRLAGGYGLEEIIANSASDLEYFMKTGVDRSKLSVWSKYDFSELEGLTISFTDKCNECNGSGIYDITGYGDSGYWGDVGGCPSCGGGGEKSQKNLRKGNGKKKYTFTYKDLY